MRFPARQRVSAWLCLVAALWTGLAPAQAFVLCIEPDGSVDLEAAVDGRCAGCGVDCRADEAAPASKHDNCCATSESAGVPTGVGLAAGAQPERCPCIDIALPTNGNDRVCPEPSRPRLDLPLACVGDHGAYRGWLAAGSHRAVIPAERPPPFLSLLRTVVLRL